VEERLRRTRSRARTIEANDDRALTAFISTWLARRGLEIIPVGGSEGPGFDVVDPNPLGVLAESPAKPGSPSAAGAAVPSDVGMAPSGTYVRPNVGPGSPLVYPVADPWLDPRPHLALGPLDIDTGRRSVRVLGDEVHITPTEFRLLCYLVEHSDRVVGHRELLLSVWGAGYGDDVHLLQETIRTLRARIAQVKDCALIESVYGTGYRMARWPEPDPSAKPVAESPTSRG
jgi:DNA-binding winged helix-turn-helix (wHTH) protein